MPKVYPNASSSPLVNPNSPPEICKTTNPDTSAPTVLTVWKKSLIFNCDGFTVFDSHGNLVYRVDNYNASNKGQMFLMDAHGATLLTIRRKKLSLGDTWMVYDGDTLANPLFLVRKNVNILNPKCLAYVHSGNHQKKMMYGIEGSFGQRCCAVYDEKRRRVAEIKQKEAAVKGVAFGKDIFRLVVQPELDTAVGMAMVILLDQMFS